MHHFQFLGNIDRWLFRNHLYRWNLYSTLIKHSDHQLLDLDLDLSSYTISWIVVQHREVSTVLLPSASKNYYIGKTLTSASCLYNNLQKVLEFPYSYEQKFNHCMSLNWLHFPVNVWVNLNNLANHSELEI